MAVRKDRIQLEVEINGKKAGQTYGQLIKQGKDLRRELKLLVPGTDAFVKKSKELASVESRLSAIKLQSKGVTTGLNQMRIAGVKVPGTFRKIGTALNSIGVLAIIAGIVQAFRLVRDFGKESLNLFDQQAKADAQLKATLQSTAGVAGKEFAELKKQASDLQGLTLFGDEQIQGAQSLLLTFTNVREEVFDRTTPVILDMATALGTDLNSASLQVGKALNDPVKGITALSRAGVQFTEDQKGMIKSLAEAGETAKAQEIILGELETQFKGSAQAAAEAGTGGFTQMKNTFNDIRESVGNLLNKGFKAITPFLNVALTKFKSFVDFLFTVPAIFAGIRASITQFVDNAKKSFTDLGASAELATKKLQLKVTLRSNVRERLKEEIAGLEQEKAAAEAAGTTVGDAFTKAYNERLNQVEDFSALASNDTENSTTNSTTNSTVNETVEKTTKVEETKKVVTTESLIKVDLAVAKAELERQSLLLEADRLQNRISEEDYNDELKAIKEQFYQDSITVYQRYGQDEANEVIKLNNQILKLNATTFAERKDLLTKELESENLLIQNQLTNQNITQVQAEELRQTARRSHLEQMLQLLTDNGDQSSNEVQKIKNELDQIAASPVEFTVTANGEFLGRDLQSIIDENLQLDLDETNIDEQLADKYNNALIAETEYQQALRELQLESLDNEIAFQQERGEQDAELLSGLYAKRKEISDEYYTQEATTRQQEFSNFQTGISATSDLLGEVANAFQVSYDKRKEALEVFEKSREGQTAAGKKRAAEERQALAKQKADLKAIEILNVQINLIAELSSIARGAATLGPIAGPIIGGIQAAAAVFKAGNAVRSIQSKAKGGQLSDNAPKTGPGNVAVYTRKSVPKISGERVSVPANISGTESGDNVLALVKKGEVVLNDRQQADLASRAGRNIFSEINVPGFVDGGVISSANTSPSINPRQLSQLSGGAGSSVLEDKLDQMIQKLDQFPKTIRAFVSLDELEESQDELDEIRGRALS